VNSNTYDPLPRPLPTREGSSPIGSSNRGFFAFVDLCKQPGKPVPHGFSLQGNSIPPIPRAIR